MKPQEVNVELGERSYAIHIAEGLLASPLSGEIIATAAKCERACIVTHPGALSAYAKSLADSLSKVGVISTIVTIPAGERYKTLRTVEKLYAKFVEAKLDRKGVVIAVGGGVLGDVVGFAAATYLRGVRFVQVPTTLLAQVDSSVGGKTGVDLPTGKNLVGAFHQPKTVLIDLAVLRSLPRREVIAGLAEVIKYGIIYDEEFFSIVRSALPLLIDCDLKSLHGVIARSCEIKAEVVSQDETELGLRAILNFGHTIGHALETLTGYVRYKHGEAISIGMISACLIGEETGVTSPELTASVYDILTEARLPTEFPPEISGESVIEAAFRDKKTDAGKLKFILAEKIGSVSIHSGVTTEAILCALNRQKSGTFIHA